jgi:hypothetical protein
MPHEHHDHPHDHEHGHHHDHEELDEKELEARLKAFQESQELFLEQNFKWLIDFVTSFFPEDQLVVRDMDLEVHFVHKVIEGGKELGALVYRFRKFTNKKQYFEEMAEDYREGLELPEVLFVDSETSSFAPPKTVETEEPFLEMPPEKLTGKMRELRDEIKRRAKIRQLRQSL